MPPHTSRLYPRACEVCAKTDGLTECPDCLVVLYCSPAHRASDRARHEGACSEVAASHAHMEASARHLHKVWVAFIPSYRILDDEKRLEKVRVARSSLEARIGHAGILLRELGSIDGRGTVTGRVAAVESAMEHMLDAIRLAGADHLGASDVLPAVYLALDMDQEAYAFVSWAAATDTRYRDGWAKVSTSHVDFRGADVLEGVEEWTLCLESVRGRRPAHTAAVLLVKVRAYLDLRDVQNAARALTGALPAEIVDLVRFHSPRGALSQRPDILRLDLGATASTMRDLKAQIRILWRVARAEDTVFWDCLAQGRVPDRAGIYVDAATEALWEKWHITPWLTTPGATDVLHALSKELVEGGQ